jgi:hypothetical protein
MTAYTRLMFSSLIFALLLDGMAGVNAIPAAVLGAAAAWVVGTTLDSRAARRSGTAGAPGPAGPGSATA